MQVGQSGEQGSEVMLQGSSHAPVVLLQPLGEVGSQGTRAGVSPPSPRPQGSQHAGHWGPKAGRPQPGPEAWWPLGYLKKEWTGGWVDEWVEDGWVDGRVSGWVDAWLDRWTGG